MVLQVHLNQVLKIEDADLWLPQLQRWFFGTGYGDTSTAFDPICLFRIAAFEPTSTGAMGLVRSQAGMERLVPPIRIPQPASILLLSTSQYVGRGTGDQSISLNLDTLFGIPTSLDKFYVTVVFNIDEGQRLDAAMALKPT